MVGIDLVMLMMVFVFFYKIKYLNFAKYYLSRFYMVVKDIIWLILFFCILAPVMFYSIQKLIRAKLNREKSIELSTTTLIVVIIFLGIGSLIMIMLLYFITAAMVESLRRNSKDLQY